MSNYQRHGGGGDALFTPREAEVFLGCGLDGDVVGVDAHDIRQHFLHGWDIGLEFGALGADRGVDVPDLISFGGDELDGFLEENLAVDVMEFRVVVREVVADVAHVGGAQQSVADGMDKYIGVAVPEQALVVRNLHTAYPTLAVGNEAVDIVAVADSKSHCSLVMK